MIIHRIQNTEFTNSTLKHRIETEKNIVIKKTDMLLDTLRNISIQSVNLNCLN